jgi:hypothetical protein
VIGHFSAGPCREVCVLRLIKRISCISAAHSIIKETPLDSSTAIFVETLRNLSQYWSSASECLSFHLVDMSPLKLNPLTSVAQS